MKFYGQCKGRRWDTEQPLVRTTSKGMHYCRACDEWKPRDQFYSYTSSDGDKKPRNICIKCTARKKRERYRNKG